MFNVYLYEKKLGIKKEVDDMKDDFIKSRQKRKEKQNELAASYKKRVENFVINMLENPIITTEYKSPTAIKIRDENPEKFLKDPQVYIKGYKHEKDRIREQLEKNQDLDYMPNQTVAHYQFRDREMKKEIQPDMRFTAKTSLERIEQLLKDHMQTQVENVDFRDKKKNKKFIESFPEDATPWEQKEHDFIKRRIMAKEIAKNLLPSLHNKTHFMAAESLYNNCPVSLCDKAKSLPSLVHKGEGMVGEQEGENIEQMAKQTSKKNEDQSSPEVKKTLRRSFEEGKGKGNKEQKVDQMEAFNPVETSKKILQICNVVRKKNQKVKHVGMGQGHLISTLEKSISEVYHNLYNKDISFPQIY